MFISRSDKSDFIDKVLKETTVKNAEKENKIDLKEIEKIQSAYVKLISGFFDELLKNVDRFRDNVKKRPSIIARPGLDAFNKFKKTQNTRTFHNLINEIFGPNEIRTENWPFTFSVNSKKKELDDLEKKLMKLTTDNTDW